MFQRSLLSRVLFPAPESSYTIDDYPEELIWIPKKSVRGVAEPPVDQEHVPCLLLQYPSARFVIIYFHSNAEDLGLCKPFCNFLREQFQVHVLAVEYPGYGICPGTASPEGVMDNALAALNFTMETLQWPLDSIKVFGRSIGTGPAMNLAAIMRISGLILVAPFLSIKELIRDRVGPLAGLVSEDVFANHAKASDIRCPTLIIHGQRDQIVPVAHGQNLYKLLKSKKLLVLPPDMEHNSNLLFNIQYFILPMFQFFSLPDYVFQDIEVPAWAWDKHRSMYQQSMQTPVGISLPSALRVALEASETALIPPSEPLVKLRGQHRNTMDSMPLEEEDASLEGDKDPFSVICVPLRLANCASCCFSMQQNNMKLLAQLPTIEPGQRKSEPTAEEVVRIDSEGKPQPERSVPADLRKPAPAMSQGMLRVSI